MLNALMTPQMNSQIHALLLDLLQTVLLLVVTGMGWAVKLWINSLNSSWKKALAERLVKYAEQKIENNQDKAEWVSEQLSQKLKGRVTPDEVSHLIEEAVVNLKAQIAEPQVTTAVINQPTEVKPS